MVTDGAAAVATALAPARRCIGIAITAVEPVRLDLRLPAFAVSAGPQLLGRWVVMHFTGFWIAMNHGTCAIGEIAEVAEHRALLTFDDG